MSDGKATCSSSSAITDESDDENDLPDENPDVNHRHLDVDFHLPSEISQKLSPFHYHNIRNHFWKPSF